MTNEASLQDVEQALAQGATVLDVRESEEYAAGHLPGARLLPLGVLPVRMHELTKDQPVYVVCQSGGRSAQAAAAAGRGRVRRPVRQRRHGRLDEERPTRRDRPAPHLTALACPNRAPRPRRTHLP